MRLVILILSLISSSVLANSYPEFALSELNVGSPISDKDVLLEKGYQLTRAEPRYWAYTRKRKFSSMILIEEFRVVANKGDHSRITQLSYAWKPEGLSYYDLDKIPEGMSYETTVDKLSSKYGSPISYDAVLGEFVKVNELKLKQAFKSIAQECDNDAAKLSQKSQAECLELDTLANFKAFIVKNMDEIPQLSCEQLGLYDNLLNQEFCLLHIMGGEAKVDKGHAGQAKFHGDISIWQTDKAILRIEHASAKRYGLDSDDYFLSLVVNEVLALQRKYKIKSEELDF